MRRADNLTTSDCLEIWEPQPPGRMRRAESRMEKPERSIHLENLGVDGNTILKFLSSINIMGQGKGRGM